MISVPASWRGIGYLIFGGVATIAAFLSFATYSRVETVNGIITPDKGVATILLLR